MKKFKKLLAMMMASAMLTTSLVGCGDAGEKTTQTVEVSDAVVTTIDGVEIPESLFNIYFWNAQQDFEQMLGPTVWELDLEGVNLEDIAKDGALKSIILSVVAEKKAEEMDIELTKEEKDLSKEGAKNFAEANPEILANHKFSQEDVETFLLSTVIISKLEQKLMENYVPAEEDVQKFIDENLNQFETVTAKHVLIKTTDDANQPLPEAEVAKKKELAEDILARAIAGEDMSELATEYSEDPGSIPTGGEYTFGRGEMVPEFEQAAFDGKDGEVWPKLVETAFGYHIIKTESHNPADEAEVKELYIQNEKMIFVQNEFPKMIESANVEKTEVFAQIKMYRPEPAVEEGTGTEEGTEEDGATEDTATEEGAAEETAEDKPQN